MSQFLSKCCRFIVVMELLLSLTNTIGIGTVQAKPLLQTNCNTDSIAHSSNTENQMTVCAEGKIGGLYQVHLNGVRSDNSLNALYSPPSTLAIHFNEHGSAVDVGQQGEFETVIRPLLNKSPNSTFLGFNEDTVTVYRSRGPLSYQITQRTFATNSMLTPWSKTDTDNWVLMEFMVENTGNFSLTGGKLLLLVDTSVGTFVGGNKGFYNANKKVYYQTQQPGTSSDFKNYGFAIGLQVKSGSLVWANLTTNPPSYTSDAALLTEMSKNNAPIGDVSYGTGDLVHWLVVDLPPLAAGQSYPVAVGLCGTMSGTDSQAAGVVLTCFDKIPLPTLDIVKSTPITKAKLGQSVPFTLTVTSRYGLPVSNIQVQDSAMTVSLVSGDNGNNMLENNERWIYTGNYVVPTTTITSPSVSTATVRGAWNNFNIGRVTTHSLNIDFQPQVQLTKSSNPTLTVSIGSTATYFITATHAMTSDGSPIISPTVNDSPATQLERVTGDANNNGKLERNEKWVFEMTYKVPPDTAKIFTSTTTFQGVDGNGEEVKGTVAHSLTVSYSPKLKIVKTGPEDANPQTFVIFNFEVSHAADSDFSSVKKIIVSDDKAGLAQYVTGDVNKNDMLDANETWFFSAGYFIPASPKIAVNQATVQGKNLDGATIPIAQSNIHLTNVLESAATIGVVKKSNTERATIGQEIRYTFEISHVSGSSIVTLTTPNDKLITPTKYAAGDTNDNKVLDPGETWFYTVDYIVPTTATNPIINTVIVEGMDNLGHRVVASAQKITYLDFSPKLVISLTNTLSQLKVGQTITPTFMVSHAANSDGSPVTVAFVLDSSAGIVFCPPNENGDTFLDKGEIWQCVGKSYTVKPTDPGFGVNSAMVQATDRTFATITKTMTYTYTVDFQPVLSLTQSSDPLTSTQAGATVVYLYTLRHGLGSDLSPIYSPTLTIDLPGTPVLVSNGNGDNKLDGGESWLYQLTYKVPTTAPVALNHTPVVTGFDGNEEVITTPISSYGMAVHFDPVLTLTVSPSALPGRGGVMSYPITVTQDIERTDQSPACHLSLNVPELGFSQSYGDNNDNCLSVQETWLLTPIYTIPNQAASPLRFTTIVTGRDTEQDMITITNTQAVELAGPKLLINIILQPTTINAGQAMTFTVIVSQSADSATDLELTLETTLEGESIQAAVSPHSRLKIAPVETASYQVTYTPTLTEAHHLTPTIAVTGKYDHGNKAVTGQADLPLTIWHNPELTGKPMGAGKLVPGGFVQYLFQIAHAAESDQSLAYLQSVEGVSAFSCASGGHEVPFGSTCLYTVTVPVGTLNHSISLVYTDTDNEVITATIPLKLIKLVYLPLIIKMPPPKVDRPVLALEIHALPFGIPGDIVEYEFKVRHDLERGDDTAVCNLQLTNDLIPTTMLIGPNGNKNGDNCLNSNETWTYTANYVIPISRTISATIAGISLKDTNAVFDSKTYTIKLPLNCKVDEFNTQRWPISPLPQLREYVDGKYHFFTQDASTLWWSRPTWQPGTNYNLSVKIDITNTNVPERVGLIFEQSPDDTFYTFVIDVSAQKAFLYTYLNGVKNPPIYESVYPGISASSNTLRVDRNGSEIKLYINGQLLTPNPIIDNSTPNSPRLGISILSFLGQSGEAYYDDFTLCANPINGLNTSSNNSVLLFGGISR